MLFLVLGTASMIAALIILDEAEGRRGRARQRHRDAGACMTAAGEAARNGPRLAVGHPQREQGLVLLLRDAAWAPLCAHARADGVGLQRRILEISATPGAPGADLAGADLAHFLEEGR
jgi:hypothetical protein